MKRHFRWRANDGKLIMVFGSFLPSSTKEKNNVVTVGPPLTNLSGSTHATWSREGIIGQSVHNISLSAPTNPSKYFHKTLVKYLSQWDGVQNSWCSYADSMSRSQLKVMGFSLEFRGHSISPLPLELFSLNFSQMFLSVRWGAETMTQLSCRLKVKATTKGHGI